ncbi:Hypothetical predicted protein [Olea europaea subsp. europaea]|uniref:Uncharacterized protein n=1 Tax=Olea europaea subsp. europaea TaxID=158383 RepID=A0A8S0S8I8_OLEEU|nr:Hypothetical predicted protein [Olea europaea subsp. europaea]
MISLGDVVESGWIYKAQGGAPDVMKGFLVAVKGLFHVLQGNKVNEAAMFENKEEQEDADDEAEVRGSLDCPKCHKQEKFEVFCVQEVISKREVEVVKAATEVGRAVLLICSPKNNPVSKMHEALDC